MVLCQQPEGRSPKSAPSLFLPVPDTKLHLGFLHFCVRDVEDRVVRGQGLGSILFKHAVEDLQARGCEKVNLQIMGDNAAVKAFYEKNGFLVEERVSMGLVTC